MYSKFQFSWCHWLFRYSVSNSNLFLVKWLQWLSNRPELIGKPLSRLFATLKKDYPIHSHNATIGILEPHHINKLTLEKIPFASGSVAQVYEGFFGEKKVAVKVRHPGLDRNVKLTRYLLLFIVWVACWFKKLDFAKLIRVVDISSFYQYYYQQADLEHEARYAKIFETYFQDHSTIVIPKTYVSQSDFIVYQYEGSSNFHKIKGQLSNEKFYRILT